MAQRKHGFSDRKKYLMIAKPSTDIWSDLHSRHTNTTLSAGVCGHDSGRGWKVGLLRGLQLRLKVFCFVLFFLNVFIYLFFLSKKKHTQDMTKQKQNQAGMNNIKFQETQTERSVPGKCDRHCTG